MIIKASFDESRKTYGSPRVTVTGAKFCLAAIIDLYSRFCTTVARRPAGPNGSGKTTVTAVAEGVEYLTPDDFPIASETGTRRKRHSGQLAGRLPVGKRCWHHTRGSRSRRSSRLEDLRTMGLAQNYLDNLGSSTENFVEMWGRVQ